MGYLRLGEDRSALGQFDQAVAALEQAAQAQPKDLKVNYTLAQAYQKAGQLEKSEAVYKLLAELNPADATTYYSQIVKMYDEAGRNENAIEAAKKVIELSPKSEIAVFNLGIMYQKLKRFDEAIATFRQALVVKPDYDAAYYNIGLCYSYQKDYKGSIEAFKNYVALVPDSADAWLNIGVGHMQLKQFDPALEPLKKAVELRPDYGAALYNLAITYLNLKDNFSAREVYKSLVQRRPRPGGQAEEVPSLTGRRGAVVDSLPGDMVKRSLFPHLKAHFLQVPGRPKPAGRRVCFQDERPVRRLGRSYGGRWRNWQTR